MAETQEIKAARVQKVTGTVVSTGGQKTIQVEIGRVLKHPQYGKYMRRSTWLAVHDEKGTAKLNDVVEIVPCRRLSRTKSWRLVRVIRAGAETTETV
jgi:small subunit ribosomal protein S17